MTRIRKSAELCMRPLDKFVHPTAIDDNTFVRFRNNQDSLFPHTLDNKAPRKSQLFFTADNSCDPRTDLPNYSDYDLVTLRFCIDRFSRF